MLFHLSFIFQRPKIFTMPHGYNRDNGGKFKDHDACVRSVCAGCGSKAREMRDVTEASASLLRRFVFAGYELKTADQLASGAQQVHPTALCPNCRLTLAAFNKVSKLFVSIR